MTRRLLPVILGLVLLSACTQQLRMPPVPPSEPSNGEQAVRITVTGLDQYDEDRVLVIQTASDQYVIGPEVADATKASIYEHLSSTRGLAVTIRYVVMDATGTTVAHKRVTGLVVEGREYRLTP